MSAEETWEEKLAQKGQIVQEITEPEQVDAVRQIFDDEQVHILKHGLNGQESFPMEVVIRRKGIYGNTFQDRVNELLLRDYSNPSELYDTEVRRANLLEAALVLFADLGGDTEDALHIVQLAVTNRPIQSKPDTPIFDDIGLMMIQLAMLSRSQGYSMFACREETLRGLEAE